MGVDGIGGGGKVPPTPAGGGAEVTRSGGGEKLSEFNVDGPEAPERKTAEPPVSDELGRLERGEISLDVYLDGQVDRAVQHLANRLPADQLDFVRRTLRQQLSEDPALLELVRRATGHAAGAGSGRD